MRVTRSKQFKKQYKKLPKKTQEKFTRRLKLYIKDKNHRLLHTHSLRGEFRGLWSFNVTSDIRAIFDASYEGVIVLVAIGSHSELYS